MGFQDLSYPRIIYIQATTPSVTTAGLLWVDSDDGQLYVADGSSYQSVGAAHQYFLSDDLIHSHDAEATTTSNSYVKLKTITLTMPTTATIRIKFDAKHSDSESFLKIYKNGGAIGTQQRPQSTSYVTFSEDLEFTDGDTLEVWGYNNNSHTTYVRNFRVYGQYRSADLLTGVNT